MVELGNAAVERAHPAAGVQQKHDGLVALFLEIPADEHLPAGRGLPIDLRERVAIAVIAELVEIPAGTGARPAHDAHRALALLHRQQGEADHRLDNPRAREAVADHVLGDVGDLAVVLVAQALQLGVVQPASEVSSHVHDVPRSPKHKGNL